MNKKKPLKILIDIVIYLLIIIVGIFLLLSIYNKYITKNKAILFGKYYLFQVVTGSMENKLIPGDYIVVEKTDYFKEGDIVTYIEDGYYITHRINKIDGDLIITKGDANSSLDKPISKDKIIGKYLFTERILTFFTRYKVIVISLLIALVIIDIAFDKKEKPKEKNVEE